MEELQSTEALDREILEDARKKAFKILKGADETLASSKTAWEKSSRARKKKSAEAMPERKRRSAGKLWRGFPWTSGAYALLP
jgi:hypothetical protein